VTPNSPVLSLSVLLGTQVLRNAGKYLPYDSITSRINDTQHLFLFIYLMCLTQHSLSPPPTPLHLWTEAKPISGTKCFRMLYFNDTKNEVQSRVQLQHICMPFIPCSRRWIYDEQRQESDAALYESGFSHSEQSKNATEPSSKRNKQ
jgi:hypothetical protein